MAVVFIFKTVYITFKFYFSLAWWRYWQPWGLNVLLFFYHFFPPVHPLESGCLAKVQGVVGVWSPSCTLQIHRPVLSCPHPSKWPCQAAISWDSLLQYRGIKAFYEAFSQPKVWAIAACVPFTTTRVDLATLDSGARTVLEGILHPIWATN